MHISLTPRLEAFVKSRVESGLYNNASEVIREALRSRMAEEQEPEFTPDYRAWVDKKLNESEEDIEAGRVSTWSYEEFLEEFHNRYSRPQDQAA